MSKPVHLKLAHIVERCNCGNPSCEARSVLCERSDSSGLAGSPGALLTPTSATAERIASHLIAAVTIAASGLLRVTVRTDKELRLWEVAPSKEEIEFPVFVTNDFGLQRPVPEGMRRVSTYTQTTTKITYEYRLEAGTQNEVLLQASTDGHYAIAVGLRLYRSADGTLSLLSLLLQDAYAPSGKNMYNVPDDAHVIHVGAIRVNFGDGSAEQLAEGLENWRFDSFAKLHKDVGRGEESSDVLSALRSAFGGDSGIQVVDIDAMSRGGRGGLGGLLGALLAGRR